MIRGIGVDAVDIERFRRSLQRTPSMHQRLFTADELAYVQPKADPVPSLAVSVALTDAPKMPDSGAGVVTGAVVSSTIVSEMDVTLPAALRYSATIVLEPSPVGSVTGP